MKSHPFHKSYRSKIFYYRNFIDLDKSELCNILVWRNSDKVRMFMKNSDLIQLDKHLHYCSSLNHFTTKGHWLIQDSCNLLGVVNINNYIEGSHTCEWGFYINPAFVMTDSMLKVFYAAQFLFFEIFRMQSITGMVKVSNKSSLLLNEFFGMSEIRREIINGVTYSCRKQKFDEWLGCDINVNTLYKSFSEFIVQKRFNNEI